MFKFVGKLFGVRPGEGRKTFLLFILHLVFYLGLMWGGFAREALFIQEVGAENLGTIFIGKAFLAILMGIGYAFLADRVSNERILFLLIGLMALWLVSVWVLLSGENPTALAYGYFYLAFGAFSDLGTLHILTYINDFYNTRAAKRAIPLMLSAGVAGTAIAGFSIEALRVNVLGGNLNNIPLAWLACLGFVLVLMILINRILSEELTEVQEQITQRRKQTTDQGAIANLRSGFQYITQSPLLRWLALATFAMVILMNLLTYQTSIVFQARFETSAELTNFYGLVDGISSVGSLIFQSLFLGRLINQVGVGSLNMLFPLLTMGAYAWMGVAGGGTSGGGSLSRMFVPSIYGRFDTKGLKQTFRNPLDAMIYNSVPLHVKSRAKGFMGGLIVPLGTLVVGLLILPFQRGLITLDVTTVVLSVGGFFALVYVVSAIRIRTEYSRSLSRLLSEDAFNLFELSEAGFEQVDPMTINAIYRQIEESSSDEMSAFLARLLYRIQKRAAIPYLENLAEKSGPVTQAEIIQMLGEDFITVSSVLQMCLEATEDENLNVRRAAIKALVNAPNIENNDPLLVVLIELLKDPDEEIQATIIPPLFASGDFFYLAPAVEILSGWLNNEKDSSYRALGLAVLAKTGSERLVRTLVRYLGDSSPIVRLQAVSLIDDLTAETPLQDVRKLGRDTLQSLLDDEDEAVRIAVVNGLARFATQESSQMLLPAFLDQSFAVRKQTCDVMNPILKRDLKKLLVDGNEYESECAAYILTREGDNRARRRMIDLMEELVPNIYRFYNLSLALTAFGAPGVELLQLTINDQVEVLIQRLFWMFSGLSSQIESQAVYDNLKTGSGRDRANAAETLETFTSPRLAQLLLPIFESKNYQEIIERGQSLVTIREIKGWQVFNLAWPYIAGGRPTVELANLAPHLRDVVRLMMREVEMSHEDLADSLSIMDGVAENGGIQVILDELLEMRWLILEEDDDTSVYRANLRPRTGKKIFSRHAGGASSKSLAMVYSDGWITALAIYALWQANLQLMSAGEEPLLAEYAFYQSLKATMQDDPTPLVAETARLVMFKEDWPGDYDEMEVGKMLTTIEKVIFLKEVPFFAGMTIDQLRVLASISEEVQYEKNEVVMREGEIGNTLFVVITGRVALQRQQKRGRDHRITRIGELGPKEYFAEMSVFDDQPYSEEGVALDETSLLLIRQGPLMTLIQQQPRLALDLLQVMSRSLRKANDKVASRSKTRSKHLMDFYDSMDELDDV